MFNGASVLVTGGTGSFGGAFVRRLLTYDIEKVLVVSRDEAKQEDLARAINDPRLRCILRDVRDREGISFVMRGGIDYVVHAAALKRIPAGESDPLEFTKTNVYGTENVIKAAIEHDIKKVVTLSTDKAAAPCTHYGATKYLAETTTIAANRYGGRSCRTRFACTRYGNVAGSRGSVIPLFRKQRELGGPLTITDSAMTRFWMTVDEAVDLVFSAFQKMEGGEVFIPKCPSFYLMDLALAMGGDIKHVGIRGSEKLHESLIGPNEARDATEVSGMYVLHGKSGTPLERNMEYRSDNNPVFLTVDELRERVNESNV